MSASDHTRQEMKRRLRAAAFARRAFPRGGYRGLGAAELQLLGELVVNGELTIPTLAEALALDRSTLTHASNELARQGLIRSHSDPDDRRRVRLAAAAAGRRLIERYVAEHDPR